MNNKRLKNPEKSYSYIISVVAFIALVFVIFVVLYDKKENNNQVKYHDKVNKKFSFLTEEKSTLIKEDNIFKSQEEIKNEYLNNYKKGNYTIDNPYIINNPFVISPQSALIMFKTKTKEKVTITLKGKHNDDIITTFEASKDHYIPVYGLYNHYDNEVIIKLESGKTKKINIKVDVPLDEVKININENKITNSNGYFYFTTSSLGMATIAYDNYGEVRWWLDKGYTKGMTMLKNGNMLLSNNNNGPDITSTSGVVEVDMLGYLHNEYEIPGGYHHDAYELEDGNLIIMTSNTESETIADLIVLLDRKKGKITKTWDLKDIVLKIDPNLIEEGQITWGWTNSVYYDKKTDALILSIRNQNSVMSLDYKTGKINWILGEKKYWSDKFSKYLIKGVGDDFIYPSGQHSVYIRDDGKLSIFNNGYNANHEVEVSCMSLKNNESYAIVYDIDTSKMEARIDWKFGGQKYFSYALSSFNYTANNHKIFNSGWHFKDEVFDNKECTQFNNDKYDANIIEFDENNNIILDMVINESKFEVVKANIYNLEEVSVIPNKKDIIANYQFKSGSLVSLIPGDDFEKLSEEEALRYSQNEPVLISFMLYDRHFSLDGAIPNDLDMSVTFISPSGDAYRYKMKEKNEEIKDFIDISKLPKGRYYIYVNIGINTYNSMEHIEI